MGELAALLKNKKNLTSLLILLILILAVPFGVRLAQTQKVFKSQAENGPIVLSGENIITDTQGAQVLINKPQVEVTITSPLGPPAPPNFTPSSASASASIPTKVLGLFSNESSVCGERIPYSCKDRNGVTGLYWCEDISKANSACLSPGCYSQRVGGNLNVCNTSASIFSSVPEQLIPKKTSQVSLVKTAYAAACYQCKCYHIKAINDGENSYAVTDPSQCTDNFCQVVKQWGQEQGGAGAASISPNCANTCTDQCVRTGGTSGGTSGGGSGGSCNLATNYQTPTRSAACVACLSNKRPDVVPFFNANNHTTCTSTQDFNHWCNGGVSPVATCQCANVTNQYCQTECGGQVTLPTSCAAGDVGPVVNTATPTPGTGGACQLQRQSPSLSLSCATCIVDSKDGLKENYQTLTGTQTCSDVQIANHYCNGGLPGGTAECQQIKANTCSLECSPDTSNNPSSPSGSSGAPSSDTPTASINGSFSDPKTNQSLTFQVEAQISSDVASLTKGEVLVIKRDQTDPLTWGCSSESKIDSKTCKIKTSLLAGNDDSFTATWTPLKSGIYYVYADAFASNETKCSGTPNLPLPAGVTSCGDSARTTVEIKDTIYTLSYKVAEDYESLKTAEPKPYTTEPTKFTYNFKNDALGTKTIIIEFSSSDGKTKTEIESIKYIGPDPQISNLKCDLDITSGSVKATFKGKNFGTTQGTISTSSSDQSTGLGSPVWTNDSVQVTLPNAISVNNSSESNGSSAQKADYTLTLTRADGRKDTEHCSVGVSELSLGTNFFCKAKNNTDIDNADLGIIEDSPGSKVIQEKTQIKKGGTVEIKTLLQEGKKYIIGLKAPLTLRKDSNISGLVGTTVLNDFVLPLGNLITPQGQELSDKIDTFDYAELKNQWSGTASPSAQTRSADLNLDNKVNSFDYACFRYDFGKTDDPNPASLAIQSSAAGNCTHASCDVVPSGCEVTGRVLDSCDVNRPATCGQLVCQNLSP